MANPNPAQYPPTVTPGQFAYQVLPAHPQEGGEMAASPSSPHPFPSSFPLPQTLLQTEYTVRRQPKMHSPKPALPRRHPMSPLLKNPFFPFSLFFLFLSSFSPFLYLKACRIYCSNRRKCPHNHTTAGNIRQAHPTIPTRLRCRSHPNPAISPHQQRYRCETVCQPRGHCCPD